MRKSRTLEYGVFSAFLSAIFFTAAVSCFVWLFLLKGEIGHKDKDSDINTTIERLEREIEKANSE